MYPAQAGPGEHFVNYTYTAANGCANTAMQPFTVYPLPDVNIGNDTAVCGDVTVTLDATTPGAVSYLWTPGNYTTPTITVDTAGAGLGVQEYSVLVTDENSCTNGDTIAVEFLDCTGIHEINGLKQVTVFPNPNSGTFEVDIVSDRPLQLTMKIFNANGVKVFEKRNITVDGQYSGKISLDNAGAGVYYILLDNREGKVFKKVLVK